jgi:hypothetical protein
MKGSWLILFFVQAKLNLKIGSCMKKYSNFKQKKPMKKQLKNIVLIICVAFTVFACSKTDSVTPATGSRAIKYEITGNYTGLITVVGVTNNDDFEIIEIKKLPWKLEFTAKKEITYVLMQGTGNGGVTGQTATLKTYVGGQEVGTGTGTALSSGFINMTNKTYLLK